MKKRFLTIIIAVLFLFTLGGCNNTSVEEPVTPSPQPIQTEQPSPQPTETPKPNQDNQNEEEKPQEEPNPKPIEPPQIDEDLEALQPNELGRIIVVMFHNFV